MKQTTATMCVTIITVLAIAGSTTAQSPNATKLESELRNVLRERWAALLLVLLPAEHLLDPVINLLLGLAFESDLLAGV